MFKKDITFTDFRGEEKTISYYFNLTKTELSKYQTSTYTGLQDELTNIARSKDTPKSYELFDKFILASYGELSDDGVHFIKERDGHRLAEDFAQTAAYDALYMELGQNPNAALEFVAGVLPKEFRPEIDKIRESLKTEPAEEVVKKLNAEVIDTTAVPKA